MLRKLNSLEDTVRFRVTELKLDDRIVPYVIEALEESDSKSLSKLRKTDKKKSNDIEVAQSSGRFVSTMRKHAKDAKKKLKSILNNFGDKIFKSVRSHIDGSLSKARLKATSSILFKTTAEQVFQLGVKSAGLVTPTGDLYDLTKSEKTWLNNYLKAEIKYFNNLLTSIKKGMSDSQISNRIINYVMSMNSIYEAARVMSVGKYVRIDWVLESDNPCPDCILLHKYSPYTPETLPTTPKAGQTRCYSYCYCSLKMTKCSEEEYKKILKKNKSSTWMLNKLKENRKKKKKK